VAARLLVGRERPMPGANIFEGALIIVVGYVGVTILQALVGRIKFLGFFRLEPAILRPLFIIFVLGFVNTWYLGTFVEDVYPKEAQKEGVSYYLEADGLLLLSKLFGLGIINILIALVYLKYFTQSSHE
jgi:hypothetical protein